MAYFGGGGVTGRLHPSLQAYLDCFDAPIGVKGWPRGGGIWDQNPMLVAHFRFIKDFERKWKDTQEAVQTAPGGEGSLGSALDQYVQKLQNEGETSVL